MSTVIKSTKDGDFEVIDKSGSFSNIRFINTGNIYKVLTSNMLLGKVADKVNRKKLTLDDEIRKVRDKTKLLIDKVTEKERLRSQKIKLKEDNRLLKIEVKDAALKQKIQEKLDAALVKAVNKEQKRVDKRAKIIEERKRLSEQKYNEIITNVGMYNNCCTNDFMCDDGNYFRSFTSESRQLVSRSYSVWNGMISRCKTGGAFQRNQPNYIGVTVNKSWLEFNTFAKWYTSQEGYVEGWDIDKDFLSTETREYGPDTCILLPRDVNLQLSKRILEVQPIMKLRWSRTFWRDTGGGFHESFKNAVDTNTDIKIRHINQLKTKYCAFRNLDVVFEKLESRVCELNLVLTNRKTPY